MVLSEERFGRAALESLVGSDRLHRLVELSGVLTQEIESADTHDAFFRRSPELIESLKSIGHDLWSWDYDGDSYEMWGGDYSNPNSAGKLLVEFFFPGRVRASWQVEEEHNAA